MRSVKRDKIKRKIIIRKGKLKHELPVNNLFAIIIVLFIISSLLSSYITYKSSRQVLQELTGAGVTADVRLCVNKQPLILQNCSTTATSSIGYYCDIDALDPDNDTIIFYDNTGLFDIDLMTGEIIFTPTSGDVGTHNIKITVSDGRDCSNSNATTSFNITILGVPGVPPGSGGGGGGSSQECIPQWECTPWSACRADAVRTRICYTLNNCLVDRPSEEESCLYIFPPRPSMPKYGEFYLCNFDVDESCFASFGPKENWRYTYNSEDSFINIDMITDNGVDISIDRDIFFFAGIMKINDVDVTGDGKDDLEFIPHRIVDGRVEMTVRLIKIVERVIEMPVYITSIPVWLLILLTIIHRYACLLMLILILLASVLLYLLFSRKWEKNQTIGKKIKKIKKR